MMLVRGALAVASLLALGLQGGVPAPVLPPLPDLSDFPAADSTAAWSWRSGVEARRAVASWRSRIPSVDALRWFLREDRPEQAMDILEAVATGSPGELPDLLEDAELGHARGEEGTAERERFERFLTTAETAARALPVDSAARVMLALVRPRSRLADDRDREIATLLEQVMTVFPGTEAAGRAELQWIQMQRRDVAAVLVRLDEVVAVNPGSCLAVEALRVRGERLGSYGGARLAPSGADPGPRLLEILAISGRILGEEFERCATADRDAMAARVAWSAWVPDDAGYSRESLERLIPAYEQLIGELLAHAAAPAPGSDVDTLITVRLPELARRLDPGERAVEAVLDRVERRAPVPEAIRFLRARRHLAEAEEQDGRRAERLERARDGFESVAAGAHPDLARRARAELAAMAFQAGHDQEALRRYQEFLRRYPDSDWAWVARLRIGQLYEVGGDFEKALAAYAQAADHHPEVPPAVVLAHRYRARVATALGRFDEALVENREVVAAWDPIFGYGLGTERDDTPWDAPAAIERDGILLPEVIETVERMEWTTARAEGRLGEQAVWLLEERRYREAVTLLERRPSMDPATRLGAWLLDLEQRARLLMALELADVESAAPDDEAAERVIAQAVVSPWTPAVSVAAMAKGALRLRHGQSGAPELTRRALQDWLEHQGNWAGNRPTDSGHEEDVRAIRNAVFLPQGGELYESNARRRWNGFEWPTERPRFLLVNAAVRVRTADGRERSVRVYDPIPGYDNVLFVGQQEQLVMARVLDRIGGTDKQQPRWIMETPNQPIGGSMAILSLWTRYFPARPGHWSGWEFTSYPRITLIEFLDAERTRARAHVTIGYGGTSVILEKVEGDWLALRTSGLWIT